jgi:hypothetical protein
MTDDQALEPNSVDQSRTIFAAAVEEMTVAGNDVFGPTCFQTYARAIGHQRKTASSISIDTLELLRRLGLDARTMVLRLGAADDGRGTQFALVRAPTSASDFFLTIEQLANDAALQTFLSPASVRDLACFRLLRSSSEAALVNLAMASGLFTHALGCDETTSRPTATGQSTFTFPVLPHTAIDAAFVHRNGQVEIDGLFLARRYGIETLFVIEAKAHRPNAPIRSIAKHKLVYPVLALARDLPADIPIVPVFLRGEEVGPRETHFLMVECSLPDPRRERVCLDELEATRTTQWSVVF